MAVRVLLEDALTGASAELLGTSHELVGKQGHRFPNTVNQGRRNLKSGCPPDVRAAAQRQSRCMPHYLLHHHHEPHECGVVFASFRGYESPLRHRSTLASCRSGGHAIWWTVESATAEDALELLPLYVANRTTATSVSEVDIP